MIPQMLVVIVQTLEAGDKSTAKKVVTPWKVPLINTYFHQVVEYNARHRPFEGDDAHGKHLVECHKVQQEISTDPTKYPVTMAHCPKDVAILAQEIGVLDSEWELYSKSEAKVNLDIHDRLAHYKVGKYLVDTVGISAQENQVRNTM
ncbi:hypothetical protein MJO28_008971 [Puccinia striiformis f. sp. tritici]|uniref:Uncharacterized protein n=1 Tax=Puccinia striiformis f. sp. tritici TaxID=168172 RepID=A0ACC0EE22_9BASI|nr:hypothetical protein MJO28_008971 [Puccinia striiformis f. sp. tritici]